MTDLLKINLSLLSKFRTELMGFSAIGILMCHACGNNVAMPSFIWQICSLGQLGVSLFFLLSGMGLFYSLKKNDLVNKLGGVFSWYSARFKKLFVPYLIMAVPYYLWASVIKHGNWGSFFLCVSTIEFWRTGGGVWFVGAIIPLYLIIPWWHKWLSRLRYSWIPTFVVFFAMVALGQWRHMCEVAFFFLGYWLGKPVSEKKSANMAIWVLIPTVLYVLCKRLPALDWVPRSLLLVIPILFLATFTFDKVGQWFKRPFQFMGKISLESYMANVMLPTIFAYIPWMVNGVNLNAGNRLLYLCVVVFGILIAWFVHRMSEPIVKRLTK